MTDEAKHSGDPGHVAHRLLPGAYRDSLVLMQLQRRLEEQPGVTEAGAMMATEANREILAERGLVPAGAAAGRSGDLVVAVRAEDAGAAEAALDKVDDLLTQGRGGEGGGGGEHRPRSLDAALRLLPEARWVLVSVPGRWAAGVARDALAAGRNVFLYSDNVPVAEEVALKTEAARRGLLVLGPDCGTAWVGGTGLGFANRVRRGAVGLVAASGTGAQAVACAVDALGEGISHGLGTGGRDLSAEVGGATAVAALELLAGDPGTEVIVLLSKPPAPAVAQRVLAAARRTGKPTVVWFLGAPVTVRCESNLTFAGGSSEAAELAVEILRAGRGDRVGRRVESPDLPGALTVAVDEGDAVSTRWIGDDAVEGRDGVVSKSGSGAADSGSDADSSPAGGDPDSDAVPADAAPGKDRFAGEVSEARWLRGLFAGGTLAAEAAAGLARFLGPLAANVSAPGVRPLEPGFTGHSIVDLGADERTVGRPHPMIDPSPVAGELRAAAADPSTRLLLFDVVLGDGAHPDPAGVLAPEVEEALVGAGDGRRLDAVAILVGTAHDPQDRDAQAERLRAAGATVVPSVREAVILAAATFGVEGPSATGDAQADDVSPTVIEAAAPVLEKSPRPAAGNRASSDPLAGPVAAVNVGLEAFHHALRTQAAASVHVDWRPPAGGDDRLARILERAKRRP